MKKKGQGKRGGLHIRLFTILTTLIFRRPDISIQGVSCLVPCTITLTERRKKLHLLGGSAFVLGPLALIYVAEVGLEVAILLKFLGQRISTALLIALLLGLSRPFSPHSFLSLGLCERNPPAGAAGLSSRLLGHLVQPSAFPSTAGIGSAAPPAFGTLPRLSPPERMLLPLSPPPRCGVSLDEIGGHPLDARRRTADGLRSSPHGLRGGGVFLEIVVAVPECRGTDCSTLASPTWVGADAAISLGRPLTGKLTEGFFLRGTREGACGQNNLVRLLQTRSLYLLAQKWHPRSQRPSTSPSLALHKIKGKLGTTNTLRKILKDQKARRARKKSFPKNFNLGSQFKVSLIGNKGPFFLSSVVASSKGFLTGLPSSESGTFPNLTLGGSFTIACTSGTTKVYPAGRRNDLGVGKVTAQTILRRAGAPENSGSSATILGISPPAERPFLLSIDLPEAEGPLWDEELISTPSEDECLDELSEEEEEVSPEVELVLVEATSALDFDELGAE
ncbi:LOW QUALITY PROTEIN: hypothetical protein Cgig2_028600 [Carnegiea gigantea]|uniref:Uncharacterized protein n=1 Tax=Carnegiea gigantea TaxID=171969 RepID=A0A9Q1K6Q5_9CARY|nr:LOW QUALITY PROTEIN: hypothetical protein Cgig2_028600 [Carnegiea gigantea]